VRTRRRSRSRRRSTAAAVWVGQGAAWLAQSRGMQCSFAHRHGPPPPCQSLRHAPGAAMRTKRAECPVQQAPWIGREAGRVGALLVLGSRLVARAAAGSLLAAGLPPRPWGPARKAVNAHITRHRVAGAMDWEDGRRELGIGAAAAGPSGRGGGGELGRPGLAREDVSWRHACEEGRAEARAGRSGSPGAVEAGGTAVAAGGEGGGPGRGEQAGEGERGARRRRRSGGGEGDPGGEEPEAAGAANAPIGLDGERPALRPRAEASSHGGGGGRA
jgi:hypothetical protein